MKKAQSTTNLNRGFSLVEVLVALSIFLIFALATTALIGDTSAQSRRASNSVRAVYLAEEGLEVVRNIRDADFSNLNDGIYGIATSTGSFTLVPSPDSVDIFSRVITISSAGESGKKIESTVTWNEGISEREVSLQTILTDWRRYSPSSGLALKKVVINYFSSLGLADFAPYKASRTVGSTTVDYTFDTGQAIESPLKTYLLPTLALDSGVYTVSGSTNPDYTTSFGEDCGPDGTVNISGDDAKVCLMVSEEKYGTLTVNKILNNGGGGPRSVSDFAPFRVGTQEVVLGAATKFRPGTYSVTESSNADYNVSYSGDCAPAGTVTLGVGDNRTCSITNTYSLTWADPNFQVASLDLIDKSDAIAVAQQGSYVYVARLSGTGNFAIVDVSNPSSPTAVSTLTLNGNLSSVFVQGNHAYVTSSIDAAELQIINVSNPLAPVLITQYNAVGPNDGLGVYVVGDRAYLARVNAGGQPNFMVLDVSNPVSPILLGSMITGANANDVVAVGSYAYLATASDTQELQVINVSNPASLAIVGSYNAAGTTDALAVSASSGSLLLAQGANLHSIDITNPLLPTLRGTFAAGNTINNIAIYPAYSYAFLATSFSTFEFRVVDYSSLTPTLVGSLGTAPALRGIVHDPATNTVYAVSASDTQELIIIRP
jgi:prepilin-type N-terminal cleavage/methylation domain-containing protein